MWAGPWDGQHNMACESSRAGTGWASQLTGRVVPYAPALTQQIHKANIYPLQE